MSHEMIMRFGTTKVWPFGRCLHSEQLTFYLIIHQQRKLNRASHEQSVPWLEDAPHNILIDLIDASKPLIHSWNDSVSGLPRESQSTCWRKSWCVLRMVGRQKLSASDHDVWGTFSGDVRVTYCKRLCKGIDAGKPYRLKKDLRYVKCSVKSV